MMDQLCAVWTVHRIGADSPPVGTLLQGLKPGALLEPRGAPDEPCVHVLRFVGSPRDAATFYDALSDALANSDWSGWLAAWREGVAQAARARRHRDDHLTLRFEGDVRDIGSYGAWAVERAGVILAANFGGCRRTYDPGLPFAAGDLVRLDTRGRVVVNERTVDTLKEP